MATQLHATCIALEGEGVLLLGASGSGKSDLALRLIDEGATLVSDDRVDISEAGLASAPAPIAGLLEVRGLGVMQVLHIDSVPVRLVLELVPENAVLRLPEPKNYRCGRIDVPLFSIYPFEISTTARIRLALKALREGAFLDSTKLLQQTA